MSKTTDYEIIAGHPVPYSLTVRRHGRTLDRLSSQALRAVTAYLDAHLGGARIVRTDRGYVYYEPWQAGRQ